MSHDAFPRDVISGKTRFSRLRLLKPSKFEVICSLKWSLAFTIFLFFALQGTVAASEPNRVIAAEYPPLMAPVSVKPGTAIEIVLEASRRAGFEIDIEFLPFNRAMKTVSLGENHLMAALYYYPERADGFTWISKLHSVQNTINTLDLRIDTLDEARKLDAIVVESGAAMDVLLTRLGFTNLVREPDPSTSARMLESGRVEAWALTRSLAQSVWKEAGFNQPLISGNAIETAEVYLVGSPNISPQLISAYSQAIDQMRFDGSLQVILDKYGVSE